MDVGVFRVENKNRSYLSAEWELEKDVCTCPSIVSELVVSVYALGHEFLRSKEKKNA